MACYANHCMFQDSANEYRHGFGMISLYRSPRNASHPMMECKSCNDACHSTVVWWKSSRPTVCSMTQHPCVHYQHSSCHFFYGCRITINSLEMHFRTMVSCEPTVCFTTVHPSWHMHLPSFCLPVKQVYCLLQSVGSAGKATDVLVQWWMKVPCMVWHCLQ